MPIGVPETERIWKEVYEPVINDSGLNPIRIEEDDDGTSMHRQINEDIVDASLIIGDITFARPNCYYEVGYAYGKGKNSNLILCCREDHNSDSPNFKPGEYKVHFDLQTYYILWWDENNLEEFRTKLAAKIERRKEKFLQPIPTPQESES